MRLLKAIAQAVACVLGIGLLLFLHGCVLVWFGEKCALWFFIALFFVGLVVSFYAGEN